MGHPQAQRSSWRGLSAATTVWLGIACASVARESPPRFPTEIQLVTVDIVVLGDDGRAVPGLRHEDFSLEVDGKPRPIARFEAVEVSDTDSSVEEAPARVATNVGPMPRADRLFVIVVDELHLDDQTLELARRAVVRLIDEGLHPGDRVRLITTGSGLDWTAALRAEREDIIALLSRARALKRPDPPPETLSDAEAVQIQTYGETTDPGELGDPRTAQWALMKSPTLGRVYRRWLASGVCLTTSGVDAQCLKRIETRAMDVCMEVRRRQGVTLAALDHALADLVDHHGRKTVILLSDGFVNDPEGDQLRQLVHRARLTNTAVHFAGARGLIGLPSGMRAGQASLDLPQDLGQLARDASQQAFDETVLADAGSAALAEETGGLALRNNNDLAAGLGRIVAEARTYYLLGFEPDQPRDRRFHKLGVHVNRPGLKVRARQGYQGEALAAAVTGPREERRRRSPATPEGADDWVPERVERDVPMRLATAVQGTVGTGRTRVRLTADVDVAGLTWEAGSANHASTVEVQLRVVPRDGGEAFRYAAVLSIELPRPPTATMWRSFARDFELLPGVFLAQLGARDVKSGKRGAVQQRFAVP